MDNKLQQIHDEMLNKTFLSPSSFKMLKLYMGREEAFKDISFCQNLKESLKTRKESDNPMQITIVALQKYKAENEKQNVQDYIADEKNLFFQTVKAVVGEHSAAVVCDYVCDSKRYPKLKDSAQTQELFIRLLDSCPPDEKPYMIASLVQFASFKENLEGQKTDFEHSYMYKDIDCVLQRTLPYLKHQAHTVFSNLLQNANEDTMKSTSQIDMYIRQLYLGDKIRPQTNSEDAKIDLKSCIDSVSCKDFNQFLSRMKKIAQQSEKSGIIMFNMPNYRHLSKQEQKQAIDDAKSGENLQLQINIFKDGSQKR